MNGSCMGGWCPVRDQCALNHRITAPVRERVCPKGKEKPLSMVHVRMIAIQGMKKS